MQQQEHHVTAAVTGRFLVEAPPGGGPLPVLAGFHGYGQTAEDQMALLRSIPGSGEWLCCSVEALHPVINRDGGQGASWMTSRHREQRIRENVAYVDRVLEAVAREYPVSGRLVLFGYSQGAGMACRTALLGRHKAAGTMLLGGDIPPELSCLDRLRYVQLARGDHDHLYTAAQMERDAVRLRAAGIEPATSTFRGGHRATAGWAAAAGRFLAELSCR